MTARNRLVLLPGLDGSGELFAPLLGSLEERFDCIVVDYPDLESFAAYVEHAQSFLPRDRAISLLAESFSGPVAIALMVRHRAYIETAVLSATFAVSPRPLLTGLAGLRPAAWLTSPALRRFAVDLFGLNGGACPTTRSLVMQVTSRSDPAVLRRRAAILHRVDVRGLLPAIDIPVLCLRASRDRVVAARHGAMLAERFANARLAEIDAPHLLLQCEPQLCVGLVIRHILGDSSA